MAMIRRPRPGGGRHPPPLAPTVSSFKPRAQWSNSGSSIFLTVNLPGFYIDQIKITKDEKTRAIHIEGQRPLSTHTKARFNEVYRVPDSCDMTKSNTSFSHGLLTIEFPVVVEIEKKEKAAHDQGKTVQRPDGRGVSLNKTSDEEKKVGTSQEKAVPPAKKEEPRTYKSVVEGKKQVPTANRVNFEQKAKDGEASPSLDRKEQTKQEKVVEKKEAVQMGQQKTVQKVKEEEARSTPTIGGSLEPKVHAKAEKVVERKGDGEIGQKLKEEGKIVLGQKKEEKQTKPGVGDEARRTEKESSAVNQAKPELKTKERVERTAGDVNGNVISKNDEKMVGDKVSEGEIQEIVKQKKVEEAGLDAGDHGKKESTIGGEDREKMVEKSSESETGPLLIEGQKKTNMDPPATEGRGLETGESQKYDISLVNVGVASLVIMGFGAYVFVPLVKMFY